ncbi:MAG TPA: hypothetical protein VFS77_15660 [Pyrinomonadaceae bacterium]|nr:hypothetical protein [Pyrinomonadaceae bacterium]
MRFGFSIIMTVALLCGAAQAQQPPPPVKEYSASSWKEFDSKDGKFSISFPGTPITRSRTLDTKIGKLTTHEFALETDLGLYYVSYTDFPVAPETPEEIRSALDSSRDQAVAGGATLISENDVWLGEVMGRELLAKKGPYIFHARYFTTKGRLFQTILTAKPIVVFHDGKPSTNPSDFTQIYRSTSKKFFESFKLT